MADIVSLDEIEERLERANTALGATLAGQITAGGDRLKAENQAAAAALGDALTGPDGAVPKLEGVLERRLAAADEALGARLTAADQAISDHLTAAGEAAERRAATLSKSLDDTVAAADRNLAERVAQFEREVIDGGFRRLGVVATGLERRFFRAVVVLLATAGFLVLALTFGTADRSDEAEATRVILYALFVLFTVAVLASDALVDRLTGRARSTGGDAPDGD